MTTRQQATAWAQSVLDDEHALILDTETTGLGSAAEIVQIAIIRAHDGEPVLDTYVRSIGAMPPDVQRIHGISDAMVANAPTIRELYERLLLLLSGRRVVIYNKLFDVRLLAQSTARFPGLHQGQDQQIWNTLAHWECAMLQYSDWVGEWSRHHGGNRGSLSLAAIILHSVMLAPHWLLFNEWQAYLRKELHDHY